MPVFMNFKLKICFLLVVGRGKHNTAFLLTKRHLLVHIGMRLWQAVGSTLRIRPSVSLVVVVGIPREATVRLWVVGHRARILYLRAETWLTEIGVRSSAAGTTKPPGTIALLVQAVKMRLLESTYNSALCFGVAHVCIVFCAKDIVACNAL